MSITKYSGSKYEKLARAVYVPLAKEKKKYDDEYSKIYKNLKNLDIEELDDLVKKYKKLHKKLAGEVKSLSDPILEYDALVRQEFKKATKLVDAQIKLLLTKKKSFKTEAEKQLNEAKKARGGHGSIKGAAAGGKDAVEGIISMLEIQMKKRKSGRA